jgi:ferric-dicitrate binding protein FerR (iron transport regulator)
MEKKYLDLNATELAQDHDFLRWRLAGDPAAREFWEGFVGRHPEKAEVVAQAARIVGAVRMNHCRLTDAELRTEQRRLIAAVGRRRMRWRAWKVAAAACVIGAVGAGGYLLRPRQHDVSTQPRELMGAATAANVRLVTADGGSMELTGDAAIESAADGTLWATGSDVRTLVAQGAGAEPTAMNKLIVPAGRRSSVTMPDGSTVWVNAGSTLEFPSHFDAESRAIRVEGEVYIEAAHDPARPLSVYTDGFTVRVLGTRFNVSAYSDQRRRTVTLVEGSVDVVLPAGGTTTLRPDDMLVVEDHVVRVERVDAERATSWRNGILDFDGQTLASILGSVSRYYGVEIECEGADGISLSGKLLLFNDIETTLDNIAAIAPLTWRVDNGRIVIEKHGRSDRF